MDATINAMATKTLKQLRELAKKAGLKGYSKLTKPDLEKKLGQRKPASAKPPATPAARALKSGTTTATKPAASAKKAPKPAAAPRTPTPVDPDHAWWQPAGHGASANGAAEEHIESAKYASHARTADAPTTIPLTDLGEDIERLPALHRSTLVLLSQKPGVLHAYWSLPAGATPDRTLQLRLCRAANGSLDVQHEATVSAARGHYYFHVPENFANHEAVVQLGYYRGEHFVSAVDRGVGRIPSLYASSRTDRWWWISEADFQRMYLRSGGERRGRALRWAGSIGSPSGRTQPNDEQLVWPGGVSSR